MLKSNKGLLFSSIVALVALASSNFISIQHSSLFFLAMHNTVEVHT